MITIWHLSNTLHVIIAFGFEDQLDDPLSFSNVSR